MRASNSVGSKLALLTAGITMILVGGFAFPSHEQNQVALALTDSSGENGVQAEGTSNTIAGKTNDVSVSLDLATKASHTVCVELLEKNGTLPAGCPLVATITVSNKGTQSAPNVTVMAPKPEGLENAIVTEPTEGCYLTVSPEQELNCELGSISPGESKQIVVEAGTSPSMPATVISSVIQVWAEGLDLTPRSSIAAGIMRVTPQSNLSVTYRSDTGNLSPGDKVGLIATVSNLGPSTAQAVRLFQTLDNPLQAQFTDLSITFGDFVQETAIGADATANPDDPASCRGVAQNKASARCNVQTLQAGESASMTVSTILNSSPDNKAKLVGSQVGVSSSTPDYDVSNNYADLSMRTHEPRANLNTGFSGPDAVASGQRVTWTLTIEDTGPSDATSVRANLALPPALTDVEVSSDHGPCDETGCDLGTLLASVDENMPGNTANIAITATIAGDANSSFDLAVAVTSLAQDPHVFAASATYTVNIDESAADAMIEVEAAADMQVSDFVITPVTPDYTGPGAEFRVQFKVTNEGPDPAYLPWFRLGRTTEATANLDAKMQNRCLITTRELMCAVLDQENLDAGQTVSIDYTISVSNSGTAGTFPDYLHVYSQTMDPYNTNNFIQSDIVVGEPKTALEVSVTATDPSTDGSQTREDGSVYFVAGDRFIYRVDISVPDMRLADARNAVLTTTLPQGFKVSGANTAGGICTIDGQNVTCRFPAITTVDAESSDRIWIHGYIDSDITDQHEAGAAITALPVEVNVTSEVPGVDGKPVSVSDSTTVDIIKVADLQLYVTPDLAGSHVSDTVGYQLTVLNLGPSSVATATVSFVVPDGYEMDTENSDCPDLDANITNSVGDGNTDFSPLAFGFDVNSPRSVLCPVISLQADENSPGAIGAGQAATARVELRKLTDEPSEAPYFEFTVGSVATDNRPINNSVVAPLTLSDDSSIISMRPQRAAVTTRRAVNTTRQVDQSGAGPVASNPIAVDAPLGDLAPSNSPDTLEVFAPDIPASDTPTGIVGRTLSSANSVVPPSIVANDPLGATGSAQWAPLAAPVTTQE